MEPHARDRNQGVWIELSDRLYVAAYSSVASLVVTFSGYFRKMNGEIIEYAVTVNPTSDRVVTEGNVFFGAGFLLSCVATLTSGNANRGQCYVRAMVQRSTGTPAVKLHNLVGGYVTDEYAPSFPFGKIEGPLEGPGYLSVKTAANPAAGADITAIAVPTGARWHLRSFRLILTTSGTAATRVVNMDFSDGTNTFMRSAPSRTQAANLAYSYNYSDQAILPNTTGTATYSSIPNNLILPAGSQFVTNTSNIQVDDQYSAQSYLVEEWIEA